MHRCKSCIIAGRCALNARFEYTHVQTSNRALVNRRIPPISALVSWLESWLLGRGLGDGSGCGVGSQRCDVSFCSWDTSGMGCASQGNHTRAPRAHTLQAPLSSSALAALVESEAPLSQHFLTVQGLLRCHL